MATHVAPSLEVLRLPGYAGRLLVGLACAVTAVMALSMLKPVQPVQAGEPAATHVNRLVHWRDAGHDWLLVADRSAHELVVYDARSGAPIKRLGADDGLGEVDSVAQFGDQLVIGDSDSARHRVVSLPALQPVAVAAR